ncbi:MAG: Gfo/Idh/MocA family oxidoreductase [Verrucomicrobiae bacterium]|nr:Gfo/Idh/MocA family oxidoreductase [Verrucomicrobiae bacterium]
MKHPLRACIIGISGFGENHYKALLQQAARDEMRAVGAVVVNQHETQEQCERLRSLGAEIFTDYREMFSRLHGKVDFCFIPTGIHLHAPMAMAAMKAGAHALVEKPLCGAIQDALAIQVCEKETGRRIVVGYNHMYAESTWEAKKTLHRLLGKINVIKWSRLNSRTDNYYARNGWAGRLRANDCWVLDSPFNNANAHQLNLLCFLAGNAPAQSASVKSVQAELYRAVPGIESADTACMRILTKEGVTLYFHTTHCSSPTVQDEVEARGEHGTVIWRGNRAFFAEKEKPETEIQLSFGIEKTENIMDQVKRGIEGREAFCCDTTMAMAQTKCVNGAHESSPIHNVPQDQISRIPTEDSIRTEIRGIDHLMHQAFQEEKLLSETGVSWAKAGKMFSMEGYRHFSGGASASSGS